MDEIVKSGQYSALSRLLDAVLTVWPGHRKYLKVNMAERDEGLLNFSEKLAGMVLRLASTMPGGLEQLAADYRFISEKIVLPEELHFRRHDEYRLKTFAEAAATVYSDKVFMTRYMNGLLATDVLWINHCRCMRHYVEQFLPGLPNEASLLEIGPGHGLLMCLAASSQTLGDLTAWDVSDASLELSRHSMEVIGVDSKRPLFVKQNIFDCHVEKERFDAIVFSEVLEHMEEPLRAMEILHGLCRPGGKVWINVPANSPAPDHLYLVREPKQAADLVEKAGFRVVETASFPMSGTTLERAVAEKLTVNCVIVGQRPA